MLNHARSLRGLLLLSGLILTVHTLVPHVHGVQHVSTSETGIGADKEKSTDWLALLTDLVDAEMGEDHLEHFSPQKTLDFVELVPGIVPVLSSAFFADRYLLQPETAVLKVEPERSAWLKTKDVFLRQFPLRGPPAMV